MKNPLRKGFFICLVFFYPHTSLAISTIYFSLFHCSSSVSLLPWWVEANPHCGLKHSCSKGTYCVASLIRLMIVSLSSSSPFLDVCSPSTTRAPPFGMCSSGDRKSTRLNSSHVAISYAVFCLKKKS